MFFQVWVLKEHFHIWRWDAEPICLEIASWKENDLSAGFRFLKFSRWNKCYDYLCLWKKSNSFKMSSFCIIYLKVWYSSRYIFHNIKTSHINIQKWGSFRIWRRWWTDLPGNYSMERKGSLRGNPFLKISKLKKYPQNLFKGKRMNARREFHSSNSEDSSRIHSSLCRRIE